MESLFSTLFSTMWIAWAAIWWILSRTAKETAKKESAGSRMSYLAPLLAAFALLWLPSAYFPFLSERFLPIALGQTWAAVGAALAFLGLLFSIWARVHLGRNWSGTVTIKEDHALITSGPYRIVRHPIYTGLLLAVAGQAIARGQAQQLVSIALVFWSFWRKSRIEETWMRNQFGEQYQLYSQTTAAIIPFLL